MFKRMRRKKFENESEKIDVDEIQNIDIVEEKIDEPIEDVLVEEESESEKIIKTQEESQNDFSWLKFSKKILFALVFLLPIFVLPLTLYPISFNQQSLVIILTLIILGGLALHTITKAELTFSGIFKSRSVIKLAVWFLLLIFIVALVNSLILSRAFNFSFWGLSGGEMDTFVAWMSGIVLFLITSIILNSKEDYKKLLRLIIWSTLGAFFIFILVNAFYSIFKKPPFGFFFNGFNTVGTIGIFSAFLGLGFLTILMFLRFGIIDNKKIRKILSIGLVLIFATLLLISHRPTFLALIFSLALFLILYIYKNNLIQVSKLNSIIFFIFVLLILNFVRLPIPSLFNLPMEISLSHIASSKIALSSLTESVKNFVFGSGPNTYGFQYLKFKPSDINSSLFWNFDFSSGASLWATLLPTLGMIGTLALFLLFLTIFIKGLRTFKLVAESDEDDESKCISISIIVVFFYMFVLSLFAPFNLVLLILFFIISAVLVSNSSLVENNFVNFRFSEANVKNILVSFVFISILIGSFVAFIFSVKRYVAHVIFGNAIYSYNTGDNIDYSISKIGLATRLYVNEDFARNLAALWFEKLKSLVGSAQGANLDTLKPQMQGTFDNAVNSMQVAILLNPLNYLYWTELGNIYERVIMIAPEADKLAFQSYTRAQQLNPKNPFLYLNLARIEVIKAENGLENKNSAYKAAEKYVQTAISIKEDYTEAYVALSEIYEKSGQTSAAIAGLKNRIKSEPKNIGLLFRLGYLQYQYGDLVGAKGSFLAIIAINPNYSNAKYYLGLIYDRYDEINKSIQEFEEILKLNPGNQDIIRILNNLKSGRKAL